MNVFTDGILSLLRLHGFSQWVFLQLSSLYLRVLFSAVDAVSFPLSCRSLWSVHLSNSLSWAALNPPATQTPPVSMNYWRLTDSYHTQWSPRPSATLMRLKMCSPQRVMHQCCTLYFSSLPLLFVFGGLMCCWVITQLQWVNFPQPLSAAW